MRESWVLAVVLLFGAAPAAHAGGLAGTPVSSLSAPTAIAAGDVDGNGFADLAIADGTDLVVVSMPGATTTPVPQGTTPTAIAIGDLDSNGRADVATLSPTALTLNTRDAAGTWHTTSLPTSGTGVAIGDVNGDGWGDVAVRDTDVVRLFIRDPAGAAYTPSTESVAGTGPIVAADVDANGLTDLAVVSGSDLAVLIRLEDGSGFSRRNFAPPGASRVNGLAFGGRTLIAATDAGIIGFGTKTRGWDTPYRYALGGFDAVAMLNGVDAVAAVGRNLTLPEWGETFSGGGDARGIAAGDFDGDGRDDAATLIPSAGKALVVTRIIRQVTVSCETGSARIARRCSRVPPTLYLALERTASSFGAFTPGITKTYAVSVNATVLSTEPASALTVSGPTRLANGRAKLAAPLAVELSKAKWTQPVAADPVTITFKQRIGAGETLRAGTYSGSVTFTLATTTP
jgi:hypothetical protein